MRRERTNIVSWVFIGDDKYIENGTNSIAIHIDTYINIIHLMIGKKKAKRKYSSPRLVRGDPCSLLITNEFKHDIYTGYFEKEILHESLE